MPSRRDFDDTEDALRELEEANDALRRLEEAKKPIEQVVREATPALIEDVMEASRLRTTREETLDAVRRLEQYRSIGELAGADQRALEEASISADQFASVAEQAMRNVVQDIDLISSVEPLSDPSYFRHLAVLSTTDEVLRAQEAMRQSLTPPDVAAARRLTLQNILESPPTIPTSERLREIEELVASPFVRDLVQRVDPVALPTAPAPRREEDVAREPAPSETIEYYGVNIDMNNLLTLAVWLYLALVVAEANAVAISQPEMADVVSKIRDAFNEIGGIYAVLKAFQASQKHKEDDD